MSSFICRTFIVKPSHGLLKDSYQVRAFSCAVNRLINQSINQSVNQSVSQSINQSVNHSTNQSVNQRSLLPKSQSTNPIMIYSCTQPLSPALSTTDASKETQAIQTHSQLPAKLSQKCSASMLCVHYVLTVALLSCWYFPQQELLLSGSGEVPAITLTNEVSLFLFGSRNG